MKLTILGCGSALPKANYYNASQLLQVGEKLFMIDCGEGAQIRLRQLRIKTARLNHIFISHLHGDHCFGLIGLISTLGMMGRTGNLYIHAHADLEKLLQPQIDYFCREMPFQVFFSPLNPRANEVIFEDKTVRVSTIPLKHGIPSCGFLFEQKEGERHLIREKLDFYQVPVKQYHLLKKGEDFVREDGSIIPNKKLTTDGRPAKRYAYCSDTAFYEKIIPIIKEVDCLFHEATFAQAAAVRAKETFHSTTHQAAEIASRAHVKQLIIGHYSARYDAPERELLDEVRPLFPNSYAATDCAVFEF
ncbi:MAG: ribonuclease Z [Prevotellaceae bacterium]|jgi:ribonuclease Z|nr:ribonuclease Z [Prevotellaceae bacterium]